MARAVTKMREWQQIFGLSWANFHADDGQTMLQRPQSHFLHAL